MWYETRADREDRYEWEDQINGLADRVHAILSEFLTRKQCEAVILYFLHQKTQQEIAEILGISRRVVSQHLFGICRNGKQIGGAINKLRKLCAQKGIDLAMRNERLENDFREWLRI